MDINEIKRKTMELLGTDNEADVDYITQEMIDTFENLPDGDHDGFIEDGQSLNEGGDSLNEKNGNSIPRYRYGHNMSYGMRTNRSSGRPYPVHNFFSGPYVNSVGDACKTSNPRWCNQNFYDHDKIGQCGGSAKLKFTLTL